LFLISQFHHRLPLIQSLTNHPYSLFLNGTNLIPVLKPTTETPIISTHCITQCEPSSVTITDLMLTMFLQFKLQHKLWVVNYFGFSPKQEYIYSPTSYSSQKCIYNSNTLIQWFTVPEIHSSHKNKKKSRSTT